MQRPGEGCGLRVLAKVTGAGFITWAQLVLVTHPNKTLMHATANLRWY